LLASPSIWSNTKFNSAPFHILSIPQIAHFPFCSLKMKSRIAPRIVVSTVKPVLPVSNQLRTFSSRRCSIKHF
jgi:hypothetical protein